MKAITSGDRRDFRDTPLGHPETKGKVQEHLSCSAKDKGKSTCPFKTNIDLRAHGIGRLRKRLLDAGLAASSPQVAALTKPVKLRAWESQSAGLAYDLEGPDSQAVTMPPAPALNAQDGTGAALVAEMAEVYAQALLRDVPFEYFDSGSKPPAAIKAKIKGVVDALNKLRKTQGGFENRILGYSTGDDPQPTKTGANTSLSARNLFRGVTPGDLKGPYLSQFLLIGNNGINGSDASNAMNPGRVAYGAVQIDQRVRYAKPYVDFMTTWEEWYSVQCAAKVNSLEVFADQVPASKAVDFRHMATPRDLSTYVHYDALYEAYLNACLYLLGIGNPFDPGIPFGAEEEIDHQQGFAHFGGPHILSLVTEVATRALKAVRFQKFNVHRRLRPEALAARLEKENELGICELTGARQALEDSGLLDLVRKHNKSNNGKSKEENILLPMAFTEGSPMHPTYGAGHATVAGACVTVLKAFFDGSKNLPQAVVPTISNSKTGESDLREISTKLKVEDELNKLAANVAIGRDWAGVHYYTDYIDSIRMGEEIAIGILEEQKLMFRERFHMSFTSFDGIPIAI